MKRIFLFLCFTFLIQSAFSQKYAIRAIPEGYDTWGYINLSGEIIIKPQFKTCYDFSENGIAAVSVSKTAFFPGVGFGGIPTPTYYNRKTTYQLINLKGEPLKLEIDEKFALKNIFGFAAKGYNNGLIAVKVNHKWGFLDFKGKLVIPIKYDMVSQFNGAYAFTRLKKQYYILKADGKEIPLKDNHIKIVSTFSANLLPFKKDGKIGYLDTTGKIVIEAQFQRVGHFNAGLAWASREDGKIGFINTKGGWVIEPQFEVVKNFDKISGLARVRVDDQWGYVGKNGKIKYFTLVEIQKDFSEGLAIGIEVGVENKKIGYFNNQGAWVIKPQFDAARNFKNGYAAVRINDKWGLIDTKGNWVLKPSFKKLRDVAVIKN